MATKYLTIFNPAAGAAFNATLPANPDDGEAHRLTYLGPYAATYPITILANTTITAQTINLTLTSWPLLGNGTSYDFVWSAVLVSWIVG